ncbi:MAG: hypothetical protein M1823_004980 [Watsoniomyces obsoletus]|nr:MAG: hypothetical protein M1823_004980 [Watsoniomyces obsoletus]
MTPAQANAIEDGSTHHQPLAAEGPAHGPSHSGRIQHRATSSDPTYLSPEDAFTSQSPPSRRAAQPHGLGELPPKDVHLLTQAHLAIRASASRRRRERGRDRSGNRKRKIVWKKLLWVKQSYPDNYTDEETFLDHLQRNPRLQPYEFWPLVADSTVIVQHVCSVVVFICCFAGIFQERISPTTVVGAGNLATVLGWVFWDRWVGQQEAAATAASTSQVGEKPAPDADVISSASSTTSSVGNLGTTSRAMNSATVHGLGLTMAISSNANTNSNIKKGSSGLPMDASTTGDMTPGSPLLSDHPTGAGRFANYSYCPPYGASTSSFSPRNQQRLATAKSASLIYCALLGLSPILKSLTKSTSSDSIWAMSCWLIFINVFFFDYGGAVAAKLPASLSTNAALMASTMLASRLPSTTHVFSLTLFSIEVFGLFPIFRRHLRLNSWRGHVVLTLALVMGAGGGVGITISGGGWRAAMVGVVLGCLLTGFAMGGCSWWLIGLQKYKNEIHGPWDPARPILRRHWD